MSEWQPIETAPKDGAWVLLYSPDERERERGDPAVQVGCWGSSGYNRNNHWVYGPEGHEHAHRHGFYGATHWMPLPEPPKP